MHSSTFSARRAGLLLPLLISLPIHVLATDPPLCCIGSCPDDETGDEVPSFDGATADKTPGIGVEFESQKITFRPKTGTCSDIGNSKGMQVDQRHGSETMPHWRLTVSFIFLHAFIFIMFVRVAR